MRVQWTRTALGRVEQIADYIALDDPSAALQMVDRLFDRVQKISDNPLAAPVHEASADPSIRSLLVEPYVVLYRVDLDGDMLTVLTVRHGRQAPAPAEE